MCTRGLTRRVGRCALRGAPGGMGGTVGPPEAGTGGGAASAAARARTARRRDLGLAAIARRKLTAEEALAAQAALGGGGERGGGASALATATVLVRAESTAAARAAVAAGAPAVLSLEAAGVDDWPSLREWVRADGSPDIDALEQRFGASRVRVEVIPVPARDSCGAGVGDAGYGSRETKHMSLSEFAGWWRGRRTHGHTKVAEHGDVAKPEITCEGRTAPSRSSLHPEYLLYLKDWHFAAEYPEVHAYTPPHAFEPDWLNAFYDSLADVDKTDGKGGSGYLVTSDYRFVYVGPAGSWTAFHSDVLRSASWSTNVCGRKRWTLLPPDATPALMSASGTELASTLWDEHMRFPLLKDARRLALTFEQEAGETVFVPPGWHHMVENVTDCISINHNWIHPRFVRTSAKSILPPCFSGAHARVTMS